MDLTVWEKDPMGSILILFCILPFEFEKWNYPINCLSLKLRCYTDRKQHNTTQNPLSNQILSGTGWVLSDKWSYAEKNW